jgi:hypothetical protein
VARDVIKRAAADAPAASSSRSSSSRAVPARRASRAERARRLVYRGRFLFLYALLAAVAGAALVAVAVLLVRGGPAPAPEWSGWKPEGSAERRASQIADYISSPYRLPSGNPLAAVTYTGPPQVTGPDGSTFNVSAIAVRRGTSPVQAEAGDVDTVDARRAVMYTLCGLGEGCSISEGPPTPARNALLRREALELALYSFKYIEGIDSALVLLPPGAGGLAGTAVFLEESDVRPELDRPVRETLTAELTPGLGEIAADEMRVIDRVTRGRMYEYDYLQAQDGTPVMVLSPAASG